MLHNSADYVNECNQIYQLLCFVDKIIRIFRGRVYIKITVFLCKMLQFCRVLPQTLDFFEIIVIMYSQSYAGLYFCYRLIPLSFGGE